jgi:hypothetical protein
MNNTELRMRTARARLQHWLKERKLARIAATGRASAAQMPSSQNAKSQSSDWSGN